MICMFETVVLGNSVKHAINRRLIFCRRREVRTDLKPTWDLYAYPSGGMWYLQKPF